MIIEQNVARFVANLKEDFPKLTDFEALQIACRMEEIEALKRAFMVSDDPAQPYPVVFEAMAIALGFKKGH